MINFIVFYLVCLDIVLVIDILDSVDVLDFKDVIDFIYNVIKWIIIGL